MNEERKPWYFTFGDELIHNYTVFFGTFSEAREKMVDKHGLKWCMQYDSADKAGVERYGLTKI